MMGIAETIVAAPHQGGIHKGGKTMKHIVTPDLWAKAKRVMKAVLEVTGFLAAIKTLLS